jgi:hypothetical protein
VTAAGPMSRAVGLASGRDAVRRLAVLALVLLGLSSIGVACWSAVNGGIGWDTRSDTDAALTVRSLDTSQPLRQAYEAVPGTSEFYGVFVYQLADRLHFLTSGSTEPLTIEDASTWVYGALATILLSTVAITALAIALALLLRSLLAGAFVWSLTLATPLWLGMSHVDLKDSPAASGMTLVTAGLILALVLEGRAKAICAGAVVAGAGGAIALSSRPGSFVLLAAVAGGTASAALARGALRRRWSTALRVAAAAASAIVCAVGFTWATNPLARIDLVHWLHDSYEIARSYPWNSGPIRVAGMDVRSTDLPYWYVPAWLGAQLPLLTLAAVLGGLALLVAHVLRRRGRVDGRTAIALVPLALQALVLPAAIVLGRAVLYDGIRHLLFVLPGLIAFAGVGIALLDGGSSGRRVRVVLALGAVAVVSASLCASIRWSPYAYAFVNPVAGHDRTGRDWELDYWGVSGREGVRRLEQRGYAPVYVEPSQGVGVPWGAVDGDVVTGGRAGVYVFLRWTRASDYGCSVLFTIERDGQVLGEGARCPNPS